MTVELKKNLCEDEAIDFVWCAKWSMRIRFSELVANDEFIICVWKRNDTQSWNESEQIFDVNKKSSKRISKSFTNRTKTFVSMIKSINYKTTYVIIVVNDWEIEQINVKIAFLYDKIHENVFVVQFTRFEQRINQICKSNKALYELKQFSRIWFETLIKFFFSRLRSFKRRI
jgi:hypothetical protein